MEQLDPFARFHPYADHRERGLLLLRHGCEMDDATYWRAVASAWQDSDRQPLTRADWRRLFLARRPGREFMMSDVERQQIASLPERVTIYRGINAWNEFSGLSWTFDGEQAEWFARRGNGDITLVISGRVLRRRIIALFQARNESEILVFPQHVYQRSMRSLASR